MPRPGARTVLTVSLSLKLLFAGVLAVGWIRGASLPPLFPPDADPRGVMPAMHKVVVPSVGEVIEANPKLKDDLAQASEQMITALRAMPFNEELARGAATRLSETHVLLRDRALPTELPRLAESSREERLRLADTLAAARPPFLNLGPAGRHP